MANFPISLYTNGTVHLNIDDLIRIFGREPLEGVPSSAFAADVIIAPESAVQIIWHCYATHDLAEKMAPGLMTQEKSACEQRGGWKVNGK